VRAGSSPTRWYTRILADRRDWALNWNRSISARGPYQTQPRTGSPFMAQPTRTSKIRDQPAQQQAASIRARRPRTSELPNAGGAPARPAIVAQPPLSPPRWRPTGTVASRIFAEVARRCCAGRGPRLASRRCCGCVRKGILRRKPLRRTVFWGDAVPPRRRASSVIARRRPTSRWWKRARIVRGGRRSVPPQRPAADT